MTNPSEPGCNPEACAGCTGCGGEAIEKITLTIEWRHKGSSNLDPEQVQKYMFALSDELAVSGVELVYINNTFSPDILDNSSQFLINKHPIESLVSDIENTGPTCEQIRKGIFQALLRNI